MKKPAAFFLAILMVAALTVNIGAAFVRENDLVVFNVGDPSLLPYNFYCQATGVTTEVANSKWVVNKGATGVVIAGVTNGIEMDVDLDTYQYFGVAYEATGLTNPWLFAYYWTDVRDADGQELIMLPLTADGKTHNSVTDMSTNAFWTSTMKTLRIDLSSDNDSGTLKVSYFVFGKTAAAVQAYMEERTPSADKPNVQKDTKNCVWTGDGYIAYKMGYESMIKDFFTWDPYECATSVVNNTWCIELNGTLIPGYGTLATADISNQMDVALDDYPYIAVRYRTDGAMAGGILEYLYWTDTRDATGDEIVPIPLNNDSAWHTDILNVSANPYWTGHMNQLRIDLFNTEVSGKLYVDYILFAKDQATAEKFASGDIFKALPVEEDDLLEDIYADGGVYGTVGSPRAGELVFMTEFDTALLSANAGMIEKVGMYVYSSANAGDASKWQVVDATVTELAAKDGKLAVMVKDIGTADFEKEAVAVPFILYKNGTIVTGTGTNAATVSVSDFSQNLLGA